MEEDENENTHDITEEMVADAFNPEDWQNIVEEWYETTKYEDQYKETVIDFKNKYPTVKDYGLKILKNRFKECNNLKSLLKNRNSILYKNKGKEPCISDSE